MKVKRFIELYRDFSPDVAFSALGASSFWRMNYVKHKCILRYLKHHYADFIAGFRHKAPTAQNSTPTIWSMWWQSDNDLPEIVKICRSSVERNCQAHPLKVITRGNFREYVDLPGYVIRKLEEGTITITHFSDIVRFYLLYHYGGLWLDSTVFVSRPLPESIFTADYYTVKRKLTRHNRNVAQDRWTSFLHASRKGCVLCEFVLDFFLEYWKTRTSLIDYFLIDYAVQIAHDELPACKKLLDDVPLVECDLYRLEDTLGRKWSPEFWEELKASALFSKLAWRRHYSTHTFGSATIYGHLLSELEGRE